MSLKPSARRDAGQRSLEPLAWAALPVIGLAVGVVSSGVGIDLLFVAVAGLFLFTLERTIGDWMAEIFGSIPATAVFALALVGFTWKVIDSTDSFFAAAEKRGYRGVYYRTASASAAAIDTGSSSGSAGTPSPAPRAAEAGSSSKISADGGGAEEDQRARPKDDATTEKSRERDDIKSAAVAANEPAGTGIWGDSRIVFGTPRKAAAPAPTLATLSLSSAQVPPARQIVLQVVVTADGRRVTEGSVEFIVNGAVVGSVPLGSRSVATTRFATYIPGMYEVRARFSGTARYEPSSTELHTLQVLQR